MKIKKAEHYHNSNSKGLLSALKKLDNLALSLNEKLKKLQEPYFQNRQSFIESEKNRNEAIFSFLTYIQSSIERFELNPHQNDPTILKQCSPLIRYTRADVMSIIKSMALNGRSLDSIAGFLNFKDIPAFSGGSWTEKMVNYLLKMYSPEFLELLELNPHDNSEE